MFVICTSYNQFIMSNHTERQRSYSLRYETYLCKMFNCTLINFDPFVCTELFQAFFGIRVNEYLKTFFNSKQENLFLNCPSSFHMNFSVR